MTRRDETIKKVVDLLRQEDATTKEVAVKVGIEYFKKAERMLNSLKAQGLVVKEEGTWSWAEKKVPLSKHDYELAITHSQKIMLSYSSDSEDYTGPDQMDPWHVVREIAMNFDNTNTGPDYDPAPLVIEHLKSGYPKSFWIYLLEYRGLQDKHRFPIRRQAVPWGAFLYLEDLRGNVPPEAFAKRKAGMFGGYAETRAIEIGPSDKARWLPGNGRKVVKNEVTPEQLAKEVLGERALVRPYPGGFAGIMHERSSDWTPQEKAYHSEAQAYYAEHRAKHEQKIKELSRRISAVPRADIDRSGELIEYLMGQLAGIIMRVRQGIPLAGSCSACPTRSVRITS
jgi:hypothetical protein